MGHRTARVYQSSSHRIRVGCPGLSSITIQSSSNTSLSVRKPVVIEFGSVAQARARRSPATPSSIEVQSHSVVIALNLDSSRHQLSSIEIQSPSNSSRRPESIIRGTDHFILKSSRSSTTVTRRPRCRHSGHSGRHPSHPSKSSRHRFRVAGAGNSLGRVCHPSKSSHHQSRVRAPLGPGPLCVEIQSSPNLARLSPIGLGRDSLSATGRP